MYKIMILIRNGSQPLWTPLLVEETKLIDDTAASPNEDGTYPKKEITETVEFSTEDIEKLETKIIEMLKTYTTSQLKVIKDVSYEIDLLIV